MRKIASICTEQALLWPVQVSNGSVLCAKALSDSEETWFCWAKLIDMPDDPGEFSEFSPAELTARIIRHAQEFHPPY